jgi:hypothetical protein
MQPFLLCAKFCENAKKLYFCGIFPYFGFWGKNFTNFLKRNLMFLGHIFYSDGKFFRAIFGSLQFREL